MTLPPIPPGSPRRTGYIYFLLAQDNLVRPMLKVGFSLRAPAKRLSDCQTGSPTKLDLIAVIVGRLVDESDLHRRFADQRSHGEWFFFEGGIRAYVEGLDA